MKIKIPTFEEAALSIEMDNEDPIDYFINRLADLPITPKEIVELRLRFEEALIFAIPNN